MRVTRSCLVIALVVAGSACDRGTETSSVTSSSAASTTTTTPPTTVSSTAPADTTTTTTTTTTTSEPTTTTSTPVATTAPAATTTVEPTTTLPRLVDVKVYLLRDEQMVIAHRDVTAPAVLRGALTELLEGPTAAEAADGLHTQVPTGTVFVR